MTQVCSGNIPKECQFFCVRLTMGTHSKNIEHVDRIDARELASNGSHREWQKKNTSSTTRSFRVKQTKLLNLIGLETYYTFDVNDLYRSHSYLHKIGWYDALLRWTTIYNFVRNVKSCTVKCKELKGQIEEIKRITNHIWQVTYGKISSHKVCILNHYHTRWHTRYWYYNIHITSSLDVSTVGKKRHWWPVGLENVLLRERILYVSN